MPATSVYADAEPEAVRSRQRLVALALFVLPCLGAVTAAPAGEIPRFVAESAAAGIDHRFEGDKTYMVGGGVAAFDCDGDDRPDLHLSGGAAPAALYQNRSSTGAALRFEAVPESGLPADGVIGAYPIDIDGDGRVDLAVLRHGANGLYRGLGGCRFEDAGARWGFDGGDEWTTAFSAVWEAGNTWPTLVFGNYIDRARYRANTFACHDHYLYRPKKGGGYGGRQSLAPGYCALSILFSDWNRRGAADLRVSNDKDYFDKGSEQLWRFQPGQEPRAYGPEHGLEAMRINGMGIAGHDVTGNGFPEYFLTNMGANPLLGLLGTGSKPQYRDIAERLGVATPRPPGPAASRPSTAWHAEFQDVDNDGRIDLWVVKGNVADLPRFALKDPNALLRQDVDGRFSDIASEAGVASDRRGRGGALIDLNGDGLLDMVVVNRWDNTEVWRNVGGGSAEAPQPLGNWLSVRLRSAGGNVHGIGAWIEVSTGERVQRREVTIGGGHAGGQLGWNHFGIGAHDAAEVRVLWPGGKTEPWRRHAANGVIVVGGD